MTPIHQTTEKNPHQNRQERLRHILTRKTIPAHSVIKSGGDSHFPASPWRPTVLEGPRVWPQLLRLSSKRWISKSLRSVVKKPQASHIKFLKSFQLGKQTLLAANSLGLSTERAGRNIYVPVSPCKESDCILSQLLSEVLVSNHIMSWLWSSQEPDRARGHMPCHFPPACIAIIPVPDFSPEGAY